MTDHHHHRLIKGRVVIIEGRERLIDGRTRVLYEGHLRTSEVDKDIEGKGGILGAITECRVIKHGFGYSSWLVKISYDRLTS